MKKMNLTGHTGELQPLDLSRVTEGMTVIDRQDSSYAEVVAVLRDKITFRTADGQYSMSPEDFVKRFAAVPEEFVRRFGDVSGPTYEECKRNLSKALDVPDDVAATILKTGEMPEGF